MDKYECGTISAFRAARDCGKGERYTYRENMQRNASLFAKLRTAGRFSITAVKGSYIENYKSTDPENPPIEVSEETFFVADIDDRGKLLNVLKRFGEEFEQDSIMFIPKGGTQAEIHGTNHCPQSWPGYGEVSKFTVRQLGQPSAIFTKVSNRPFNFLPEITMNESIGPNDYHGRLGYYALAEKHWSQIEV